MNDVECQKPELVIEILYVIEYFELRNSKNIILLWFNHYCYLHLILKHLIILVNFLKIIKQGF